VLVPPAQANYLALLGARRTKIGLKIGTGLKKTLHYFTLKIEDNIA
jgi:hypothetical protein